MRPACHPQSKSPVGHMPTLAIHQRTDDISQSSQGQVDLDALFQAVTRCSCLALPLTARQIHEVQLAHPDVSIVIGCCCIPWDVNKACTVLTLYKQV